MEWVDFEDLFGGAFRRQAGYADTRPQEMNYDSMEVRVAIQAINAGRYADAIQALTQVNAMGRDARWHYLFALAQYGAGNTMTALEEMQRAAQMEPGNVTYQELVRTLEQGGGWYERRQSAYGYPNYAGGGLCTRMCMGYILCSVCFGGGFMCLPCV